MIPNLREAREVWWCEEHSVSAFTETACWQGSSLALLGEPHGCHMVPKALVDPALAEWVRSLFQECGQCKGKGSTPSQTQKTQGQLPCLACNGSGQVLNEDRVDVAARNVGDYWTFNVKRALLAFLGYEEGQ